MIPLIIDTDPGIDDAAAITMAILNPEIDLRLITTVAGNVNVEQTTTNALKLVQFFGVNIPVASGASRPLFKEYEDASYAHGQTGMGGYDFGIVDKNPLPVHAVEALHQELSRTKEAVTIVAIGALTNIALLIRMYPDIQPKIKEIILMGGSLSGGNITGAAEFNIYSDPHAAKIVFKAGIKLTMIGLDLTLKTKLTPKSLTQLKDLNKTGNMLYSLFRHYHDGDMKLGLPMHDVTTIYYLLERNDNPQIKTHEYYVEIQTSGPAIGATVADIRNAYHDGQTNVTVGLELDQSDFNQWFLAQVKKGK